MQTPRLPSLQDWARGEPITARHLNEVIDAVRKLNPVRPPRQVTGGQRTVTRQFVYVSMATDYMICHTWDGTTEGTDSIAVALPYLLRRTPFDGVTRNGISYVYSSAVARVASKGGDDENQTIVPAFVAGDIIYACSGVIGGTDVTDSSGYPVRWLCGHDGRAWAKVYEEA